MDRKKILSVVRGYLLKEKKNTVLTGLFLCFITVFLLIGNQLFANVQMANRLNAEALEGRQHVTYSGITEAEFQKIKACDFVADAGLSFHLWQAEDGTAFDYIDESFRDLGATVAEANIKQTINGCWAQKEEEAVFTKNYMERYGLELGDTVSVCLTATDADTGDVAFRIPGLTLTVAGVIDNMTGFTDRKNGYVSEELTEKILREKNGRINGGLCQGGMAAGVTAIVQAALSMSRQESFFRIFAVTDAGVVTACVVFPVFILWYMFHKRMAVS